MPNEYSNFTSPDAGSTSKGYQGAPDPNNVGSNGYVWDPGSKSYVKVGSTQLGGNASPDGVPQPGVNGLLDVRAYDPEAEKDRYRGMAQPIYASGPAIDHTVSNESRGLSMGALGMLGARAGGAATPAQLLARQQTAGAVAGIQSGAASIRGGAGARAAAARGAYATGARIEAQGAQDEQALRAREMADASGQYFGAASAQRGRDIGMATDQAKLDAGQRVANEQRSENYEGLGFGTQKENVDHVLGRTAEEANAANASRTAGLQEGAASRQLVKDVGSTVIGGTTGALQGYAASQQPEKSSDPWDPSRYSGSDERMKYGVTTHLKHAASKVYEGARDLRDRYVPSQPSEPIGTVALHGAIMQSIEGDTNETPNYGVTRADGDISGHNLHLSQAEPGYAASRAGQAGYMFGGAPPVTHGFERPGAGPGDSPMTQHQREVMMSDDRAKAAAWDEGHKAALDNIQKVGRMSPEQLKASERPEAAAVRSLKADAYDEGDHAVRSQTFAAKDAKHQADVQWHQQNNVPLPAAAGSPIERPAAWGPAPVAPPPPAPPPAEPGYLSQLAGYAGRARAMVSDGDTKYGATDVGAMADANRSMKPRAYKYKDGFAQHEGQSAGEENIGPIAQDMYADPVASTAIVKDPNTGLLGIDKDKGLKLVMGSVSDLQAQLDAMKGKRKA